MGGKNVGNYFELNTNIKIESEIKWISVQYGIDRFIRDINMTLKKTTDKGNIICLDYVEGLKRENYRIYFDKKNKMRIEASDELGFIYALIFLSEKYLKIQPFWFWNDQKFKKQEKIIIPINEYHSIPAKVPFRGWFINDEVLIDKWSVAENPKLPWEMAFEALLRCGGNMIIPGTDKNAKKYRNLASNMGLWITHHHAEPLGAEIFARAYPNLTPSYSKYSDLFHRLWLKGIESQRDMKVVWTLGFRGQGDYPFWVDEPEYNTPKKRGNLISSIIKLQYDMLKNKVKDPICCTYLYGETMELYRDGVLDIPDEIIKIWSDNGYGKMVSRRQNNYNPRVPALPNIQEVSSKNQYHGLYYHVSFYDLQAANHLTMSPNSVEFINNELQEAFSRGVDDYLIVNSSNIKPHVYQLDVIREIWSKGYIDIKKHGLQYAKTYYRQNKEYSEEQNRVTEKIYECFTEYPNCTIQVGSHEDERAGEQFTNYTTRILAYYWLKFDFELTATELHWATGDINFKEQVKWYKRKCKWGEEKFKNLELKCEKVYKILDEDAKQLFEDSIYLQVRLQRSCIEGAIKFCQSFELFRQGDYQEAFFTVGKAIDRYQEAVYYMKRAEHDKWKGFYQNDCLCDVKYTAYFLRNIMGCIRNIGDGPYFYKWQRKILYSEVDRKVMLLTNTENHLTDEELYKCMKRKLYQF